MSRVTTVKIVDPRIKPQPDPVYATTISAKQNQFYKIPASGLSNSYVTFNNLTTLGADRAYLDTFEIETTIDLIIRKNYTSGSGDSYILPESCWTFDSFPLNKCVEEARVNVNGGAFFSSPLSYVRAKERYWDEEKLNAAYANVCPIHKPMLQSEMGVNNPGFMGITPGGTATVTGSTMMSARIAKDMAEAEAAKRFGNSPGFGIQAQVEAAYDTYKVRTRFGEAQQYYARTASGALSSPNNSIVPAINGYSSVTDDDTVAAVPPNTCTPHFQHYVITWREPIFASPFSSKLDNTYGRPLYNITSLDIALNLQNLGNMIRVWNKDVVSYTINIRSMQLCYQVMTVPIGIAPPLTVVPYRRFVPYITDFPSNPIQGGTDGFKPVRDVTMTSGVYTLNEIPTGIWIFAGPTKANLQNNLPDGMQGVGGSDSVTEWAPGDSGNPVPLNYTCQITRTFTSDNVQNSWAFNKSFGYLKHVSISLANTTQILNTASQEDLYRIAKANGCQDCFEDWARVTPYLTKADPLVNTSTIQGLRADYGEYVYHIPVAGGCGSVLRLIPGTDMVLPDQDLYPGANANNMVFQVEATFDFPSLPSNYRNVALWILFEYVGVATITPGQCQITMNPLGSGTVMNTAPVVDPNPIEPVSTTEGSGLFDIIKGALPILKVVGPAIANLIGGPVAGSVANAVANLLPGPSAPESAAGGRAFKRARIGGAVTGGAKMGLGDFC